MSDESSGTSNAVPYERFTTVNDQRKAAEQEVQRLKQQLADVSKQAGAADALFTQLETVNKTLETERGTWATERSLMSHGLLDQEARDLAIWSYQRLGDDKPELGDWLSSMKEAPDNVPAYLKPYFGQQPQQAKAMPDTNKGALDSGLETAAFKRGSISSMTLDEYREHREKIKQRYLKK